MLSTIVSPGKVSSMNCILHNRHAWNVFLKVYLEAKCITKWQMGLCGLQIYTGFEIKLLLESYVLSECHKVLFPGNFTHIISIVMQRVS